MKKINKAFWLAAALSGTMMGAGVLAADQSSGQHNKPYNGQNDYQAGQKALSLRLSQKINKNQAKNVIVFIGDGMGISTITAARIYDGQSKGKMGEGHDLSFDRFPHTALIKTYNTNQQVADSAGTASAIHTGVKTRAGMISVGPGQQRAVCKGISDNSLQTMGELAAKKGKSVGVVSTARITHATPATVYAHSPERDWEADKDLTAEAIEHGCSSIAEQLVTSVEAGTIDVALGGGRKEFTDAQMARLEKSKALISLYSGSHMAYMLDKGQENQEPTLKAMALKALERLEQDQEGYYLMVEGGRIDHGHHDGIAGKALSEAQAFSDAIAAVMEKVNLEETLILVTADHSHVFTIAGYPTRGNPILGHVYGNDKRGEPSGKPLLAADKKPYTTLGYQNGPGSVLETVKNTGERPVPEDHTHPKARQQALVPYPYETHGGEDVALFAIGPWSHLTSGVMEQNVIFHLVQHAFGWTGK